MGPGLKISAQKAFDCRLNNSDGTIKQSFVRAACKRGLAACLHRLGMTAAYSMSGEQKRYSREAGTRLEDDDATGSGARFLNVPPFSQPGPLVSYRHCQIGKAALLAHA